MKSISVLLLVLASVFISICTHAHKHNHVKNESHSAHTHGLADMAIVFEDNLIDISFSAPAESLVGFEHIAESAKDKQKVKQVRAILTNTLNISDLEAHCSVIDKHINTDQVLADTKEHVETKNQHAEVKFNFRYKCNNISEIETITIKLFEHFPRLERIRAVWLTNTTQGLQELTAQSNHIGVE